MAMVGSERMQRLVIVDSRALLRRRFWIPPIAVATKTISRATTTAPPCLSVTRPYGNVVLPKRPCDFYESASLSSSRIVVLVAASAKQEQEVSNRAAIASTTRRFGSNNCSSNRNSNSNNNRSSTCSETISKSPSTDSTPSPNNESSNSHSNNNSDDVIFGDFLQRFTAIDREYDLEAHESFLLSHEKQQQQQQQQMNQLLEYLSCGYYQKDEPFHRELQDLFVKRFGPRATEQDLRRFPGVFVSLLNERGFSDAIIHAHWSNFLILALMHRFLRRRHGRRRPLGQQQQQQQEKLTREDVRQLVQENVFVSNDAANERQQGTENNHQNQDTTTATNNAAAAAAAAAASMDQQFVSALPPEKREALQALTALDTPRTLQYMIQSNEYLLSIQAGTESDRVDFQTYLYAAKALTEVLTCTVDGGGPVVLMLLSTDAAVQQLTEEQKQDAARWSGLTVTQIDDFLVTWREAHDSFVDAKAKKQDEVLQIATNLLQLYQLNVLTVMKESVRQKRRRRRQQQSPDSNSNTHHQDDKVPEYTIQNIAEAVEKVISTNAAEDKENPDLVNLNTFRRILIRLETTLGPAAKDDDDDDSDNQKMITFETLTSLTVDKTRLLLTGLSGNVHDIDRHYDQLGDICILLKLLKLTTTTPATAASGSTTTRTSATQESSTTH